MKIVFLSKRHPQGKDLLTRPYGRFFHIPRLLAEMGHEVHILLLCYDRQPTADIRQFNIQWYSRSLWHIGGSSYWSTACTLMNAIKPDWIVGFSDTYFGILAEYLGRKFGIMSAIDAYDNYESYLPWCKPLHFLWRQAVSKATAVTAAGPQLSDLLKQSRPNAPVHIIPMAADAVFKPIDRIESRRLLNLPLDKKIVGYCGSIYRNRGIDCLFHALESESLRNQGIELILTGRKQRGIHLPVNAKWLGYLPDDKIPYFLNSLDVAVVSNQVSRFGSYSYPVKLYEAMKCQIPVVATATTPARWILNNRHQFLTSPGDSSKLARKICDLLPMDRYNYGILPDWTSSSRTFEKTLQTSQ
jgi:glycosyltransferase involved in cell wall biosynthesis